MIVVGSEAVKGVKKALEEFKVQHGLNANDGVPVEPPLPPLIENDAFNLGAELNAALEAKQDSDNPPDLGDGGNHNSDGANASDDNASDSSGPDDDHKEMEGEHVR